LVGQEIVRLDSEVPNGNAELIDKTKTLLDETDSISTTSSSSSSTSSFPDTLDGLSTDAKRILIGKALVVHLKKWCKHAGIQKYQTMKKEELKQNFSIG